MLSVEMQRRVDALCKGSSGAVLHEWVSDLLSQTKDNLVSATIEKVPKLQGQAAAYTQLLSQITKGRE